MKIRAGATSRVALGLVSGLLLGHASATAARAATEIKIATLAPRGSIWMRYLDKMKAELEKRTKGAVTLRYYPGQIQGDERDVVRKMRTGQLHGGAFTAVGLAMLDPSVLVLQLPHLFESYAQADKVRNALTPRFEQSLAQKGHVLLGWTELGWIHVFTRDKALDLAALRKQRMWVQSDDPIGKAMMSELSLKPLPMGVPQVYPALNSGMVNAVYNSPLGCLALQWHGKLRYMVEEPLALGIGATVVSASALEKLTPADRRTLIDVARRYHRALLERIRRDNDKAVAALRQMGMTPVTLSARDCEAQKRAASAVAEKFVPRYYSRELLTQVRDLRQP